MEKLICAMACGVLVLAAVTEVSGQASFQGGIRGTVRDANGVVPGAEVTLTNEATNSRRSTITNQVGEYVFSAVAPGTYTLGAALTGFRAYENKALRIGTQTFLTIDITLELGAIQETITVTGVSPLIETSNASRGEVLDSVMLETLPAPGRNAFLIAVSIPTVIPSGDAQFNRQQDQTNASLLSLGGGARRANNYLLDGVPITDMRNRASANPPIEAIEDMKVQVHTYDAQMGRTGGGVFNLTAKSGSNEFRGSGFFQFRPKWGAANNYFSKLAGVELPDTYYYLGGGGFGGPIIQDRTFFWFSTEDYQSLTTRNISVRMPTDLERNGDFSQTFDRNGNLILIYDPTSTTIDPATGRRVRRPFDGNRIPNSMIDSVARNMLQYLPRARQQVSNGLTNFTETAQLTDKAQMYTGKVEHKFTDQVSLSGFYLYNRTDEPEANYFEGLQTGKNRFADPNDYILKRRPQIVAINNTWVPNASSVVTFRYGYTRFPDNNTLSIEFDPSTLGFHPSFSSALPQKNRFPQVRIRDYDQVNSRTLGAINPTEINYYSNGVNGSYSKSVGTHTFKTGADYRKVGVEAFIPGAGAGLFDFDQAFTSCDPTRTGTAGPTTGRPDCGFSGNSFASYLLGFPTGNPDRPSSVPLSTPFNFYTRHVAGYFQDDWRIGPNFTLNYGLRVEHDEGLREVSNATTVAFDPSATSALTNRVTIPADPIAGTPARQVLGGLVYAGQNGAPTEQGNLPTLKWAPRAGAVYSLNARTVIRGGYGIFWAPSNFPAPGTTNYGQIGYTQTTPIVQDQFTPTTRLDNPFPGGFVPPLGNSLEALTGIGTNVTYISETAGAPRVQQYSVDIQRELPGNLAISVGYVGARGDHLGLGGTADATININQLDPKFLALGPALTQSVPNPFFGLPEFAGTTLGRSATVQRRQLLRPYPHFLNLTARQITEGKSRYHAAVFELHKRLSRGWGGRFSYTYSVLKDNQFGETNFFSGTEGSGALNHYNFVKGSPYYNPDAEFGYGLLDVPHRLVLSPIVELPFGQGKKWMSRPGVADTLLGGWTISAIINLESGFPISVYENVDNSNSFGGANRPNIVPGVDPNSSGDDFERITSWINPAAFSRAPSFTFGNAPHTLNNLRTRHRHNADVVFAKNVAIRGSLRGQLRIEMINITNTVKVRGPVQDLGASDFGQIARQSGFMRLTQLSFRVTF